jgi:hypothetical protein
MAFSEEKTLPVGWVALPRLEGKLPTSHTPDFIMSKESHQVVSLYIIIHVIRLTIIMA